MSYMSTKLFRESVGTVLRKLRQHKGHTLREVAERGHVSLGYLSEVERGLKEASSEMLDSIARALGLPLWHVMRLVAHDLASVDGYQGQVALAYAA
jgi:transcriptional regulator with XRE-family HTH domain